MQHSLEFCIRLNKHVVHWKLSMSSIQMLHSITRCANPVKCPIVLIAQLVEHQAKRLEGHGFKSRQAQQPQKAAETYGGDT